MAEQRVSDERLAELYAEVCVSIGAMGQPASEYEDLAHDLYEARREFTALRRALDLIEQSAHTLSPAEVSRMCCDALGRPRRDGLSERSEMEMGYEIAALRAERRKLVEAAVRAGIDEGVEQSGEPYSAIADRVLADFDAEKGAQR